MSSEVSRKFAKKLKILRESFGITQEELALRCNFATSTIERYEKCKRKPSIDSLQKIADAFGIKLHELINLENIEISH